MRLNLRGICREAGVRGYRADMTAVRARSETVLPKPARTPAAIRAVLEANAPAELVAQFDAALDAAWVEAREGNTIEPLNEMLKRWWFEASDWCDPAAYRAHLAQVDDWTRNGLPPGEERLGRDWLAGLIESKRQPELHG